jgi:glycosyltransferase involved in cell wall biosynthesis
MLESDSLELGQKSDLVPDVSVVVPAFNASRTVKGAIASALGQVGVTIEVIVADDGSTDDTCLIAESFGSPVRVLRLSHSGLPAVCRNAGIRAARGEYVAFLDADDEWLPGKLAVQFEVLESKPATGLVCSNALRLVTGPQVVESPYFTEAQMRCGMVLCDLVRNNFVITSTAVVRNSALQVSGPFREDASVATAEDYDLWLRLAAYYEVVYLPAILAVYRDEPKTYRSTVSAATELTNRGNALIGLLAVLSQDRKAERTLARGRVANLSLDALGLAWGLSDWRLVSRHIWRLARCRAWRPVAGRARKALLRHGRHDGLHEP